MQLLNAYQMPWSLTVKKTTSSTSPNVEKPSQLDLDVRDHDNLTGESREVFQNKCTLKYN